MEDIEKLIERITDLENRMKFLEDTISALSDMSVSEQMKEFLYKRQRALAFSKLMDAANGLKELDVSAQQLEIDRIEAEKAAIDARIAKALHAARDTKEIEESSAEYFTYQQVSGGLGITSYIGFGGTGEISVPSHINDLPVVRIEDGAFQGTDLGSIILPDTVIEIGKEAFKDCKQLRQVNIPRGVVRIGKEAFKYCTSLKTVNIPNGLESLGFGCFSRSGLTQIDIPTSIRELPQLCFSCCSSLRAVSLSEGLESIEYRAFGGCREMNRIVIPASVKRIRGGVFNNDQSRVGLAEKFRGEQLHIAFLGSLTTVAFGFFDDEKTMPADSIVYCKAGSEIQKEARKNGLTVKPLSEFSNE